ncbi:hypothetical protein EC991_003674 [Linnemannia zychae]|nr:hypothetical protein EC991_003674 [Linnemannia zychae]
MKRMKTATGLKDNAPAVKRKREQDDRPNKRMASNRESFTIIKDMHHQDAVPENGHSGNSDDIIDFHDDCGNVDNSNYKKTSVHVAPDLVFTSDSLSSRDQHLEHWRAWCERKRYPNSDVTGEKFDKYIKESLAPKSYRDKNNPHLEILPIRVISGVSEEGEVPASEDVDSHISSIQSLYREQCKSKGLRPDIDGVMKQPGTLAAISWFRDRNSLRYLWIKGYYDQECNSRNQWCGTQTRLCLASYKYETPSNVLRHTTLASLYPVRYMDDDQGIFFGLAVKNPYISKSRNLDFQPILRLFRHQDAEMCPVGCLAMYLFAQWMDDSAVPDFKQHKWETDYLIYSQDASKMTSVSTYLRQFGVALGMASTGAADAIVYPKTQRDDSDSLRVMTQKDNTIPITADSLEKKCTLGDDPGREPHQIAVKCHLREDYVVLRDIVVPPLELQRQIFPFIEKLYPHSEDWRTWIDNIMMNRAECTGRSRTHQRIYSEDRTAAIRLMLILAHLRKIILQDIVELKLCTMDLLTTGNNTHPIADCPVFRSPEFFRFAHQLQEAMLVRATRRLQGWTIVHPVKPQLRRRDAPFSGNVSPIITTHSVSNSAQLPTPTDDSESDKASFNSLSLEPAQESLRPTVSQLSTKQKGPPQELLAIRPTGDDDPDILEIKTSLASIFKYFETESKAVGNFASATFSSLENLQIQMACVEKSMYELLDKESMAESKPVEQPVVESDLRQLSSQQDARLDQWLQQQIEVCAREERDKKERHETGSQYTQGQSPYSANSVGKEVLSPDKAEAQSGSLLDINTLREKMSRSKALNQDVKRRISNLEAVLLAVGESLQAITGGEGTEEQSEAEGQGDSGEKDEERDEPSDEEENDHQDETWEHGVLRRSTRLGYSQSEMREQNGGHSVKLFYPKNLCSLADQIAALYPQLKADKVRTMQGSTTIQAQISLGPPTTLRDIWLEHFSAKGSTMPSFWSLVKYAGAWQTLSRPTNVSLMYRKKTIIAVVLREVERITSNSLKVRVEKGLAAVEAISSKSKNRASS